jgi:hypothetical protein
LRFTLHLSFGDGGMIHKHELELIKRALNDEDELSYGEQVTLLMLARMMVNNVQYRYTVHDQIFNACETVGRSFDWPWNLLTDRRVAEDGLGR